MSLCLTYAWTHSDLPNFLVLPSAKCNWLFPKSLEKKMKVQKGEKKEKRMFWEGGCNLKFLTERWTGLLWTLWFFIWLFSCCWGYPQRCSVSNSAQAGALLHAVPGMNPGSWMQGRYSSAWAMSSASSAMISTMSTMEFIKSAVSVINVYLNVKEVNPFEFFKDSSDSIWLFTYTL